LQQTTVELINTLLTNLCKETQYAKRQLYVCMMHLEVCIFSWLLFEPGFTGNFGGVGFPLALVLCSEYNICSRHEPIIPQTPNYVFFLEFPTNYSRILPIILVGIYSH